MAETEKISAGVDTSGGAPAPPPLMIRGPDRTATCKHGCGFTDTITEVFDHETQLGCQKGKDLFLSKGGTYVQADSCRGIRPCQEYAAIRLAEQRLFKEALSLKADGRMSTDKCNFCAKNALLNELENGNLYDPHDLKGPGGRAFPLEGAPPSVDPVEVRTANPRDPRTDPRLDIKDAPASEVKKRRTD